MVTYFLNGYRKKNGILQQNINITENPLHHQTSSSQSNKLNQSIVDNNKSPPGLDHQTTILETINEKN